MKTVYSILINNDTLICLSCSRCSAYQTLTLSFVCTAYSPGFQFIKVTAKCLSEGMLEVEITLLQVSLMSGTGSLGREFWKLYSIGFLPENTFTSNLKSRAEKRGGGVHWNAVRHSAPTKTYFWIGWNKLTKQLWLKSNKRNYCGYLSKE